MSICKSCGAEIFWQKLPNGKLMPYDAEPYLVVTEEDVKNPAYWCDKEGAYHITHFATCPNANQHRKRGNA